MKALFILIAVFSFLNVYTQDTIYYDKKWKKTSKSDARFYRIYSQVGAETKIADYYINDTLQMTGFARSFDPGKPGDSFIKHGLFVYYSTNGKMSSKGNYKNDEQVGEWLVFYPEGQLYMTENYDRKGRFTGNLIIYYPDGKIRRSDYYSKGQFQKGKCYTSAGNDTTWFPYGTMPQYPGGEEGRNRFLSENIVYPENALMQGIRGTVYISFVVDIDGSIVDVTLLQGVSPLLDNEALRVVKMMPQWKPGLLDAKPVRVLFNMPVHFKIK